MKLSTAILAGGKSRRMGQNKALLSINNKRFIEKISEELSTFDEVLISAAQRGEYEYLGYDVVYDCHSDIGPIEGIYQALSKAKNEYVFVVAADMPFVNKNLVEYITTYISTDYDAYVIMDEEHVHPLCAIYSKKLLPIIEELINNGQYRLMNILNAVNTKYISLKYTSFNKKVVKNINTKDEYKKLVLPVVFAVSGVKDSGKTGLIVKLINEFIKEGYSVAVIKHDGHDYVMDHEDTDTYRFSKEGAKYSIIYSDNKFSVNASYKPSVDEIIKSLKDVDIIILEGQKNSDYPKIEVIRSEVSSYPVCKQESLICIATDVESLDNIMCPIYGLNDVKGVFLCLKSYFGLE